MTYIIVAIIFVLCSTPVVFMLINSLRIPDKIKKAEELFEQGKYNESGDIVRNVLEKRKDNVRARYVRAQILMEQKQYLLAISELNGILAISDFKSYVNELDIHHHLAEMYKATNNFPKEIEEYRVILAFDPENVEANMRMGMAMYNKQNYPKAQEYLLKAVTNGQQPSPYLLPLGVSMFYNGEYEKSEQYLLESLESDINNIETRFYLGLIYKSQKNYDKAINMFAQSKKDNRFYVQSLRALGEIYFAQEQYEEVIDCLEPGIDKLNDTTKDGLTYRYLLAESYEIKSRIKDAITVWESINKINPDFRDVKNRISTYRSIGNNQHIMDL
ncbi:MAG: tetratricopeptide repeat protein, partial [Leptospirales bacterium]|nr:tetratricopeptide repeat protein [Leptospirales bacterium]